MLAQAICSHFSSVVENEFKSCNGGFALALSPGFFGFYSHIGILHALQEEPLPFHLNSTNDEFLLDKVSHVSGSSAGAIVGGFLAAGMKPSKMIEFVLRQTRSSFWDMGGIGGLLRGQLFQRELENALPPEVINIEDCPIPFGCTAYSVLGFRTRCLTSGPLAVAIRASATFPGLFQPVLFDGGWPHIDGGVWDTCGLMALPLPEPSELPQDEKIQTENKEQEKKEDQLVVNIVFGSRSLSGSKLPDLPRFRSCKLLSIVVDNIPSVNPFTMETMGPKAYEISRLAMKRALRGCHMQELSPRHWCCYVDGHRAMITDIPSPVYDPPAESDEPEQSDPVAGEDDNLTANDLGAIQKIPSFSFLNGHYFVPPALSSSSSSASIASSAASSPRPRPLAPVAPSASASTIPIGDGDGEISPSLEADDGEGIRI